MIVLVVPTYWECRTVLELFRDRQRVSNLPVPAWRHGPLLIVRPGMGPDKIARLVPCLSSLEATQIWLCGWCGGLCSDLACGDVILSSQTVGEDGRADDHPPDPQLHEALAGIAARLQQQCRVGPVLSSDHLLMEAGDKPGDKACLAVEMEAAPLARWNRQFGNNTSFVHLRFVMDPLSSSLPGGNLKRLLSIGKQLHYARDLVRHARHANRVMNRTLKALLQDGFLREETTTMGGHVDA